MGNGEKRKLPKIIFVILLVGCVALAFTLFIKDSNDRATTLSSNYIKDATVQSQQRIDEVLKAGKDEIQMTATLYETTDRHTTPSAEDLKKLTGESAFDYIEFVSEDGTDLSMDGTTEDVSDRSYFQDGIQGNAGVDVVIDNRVHGENLVVFYAPLPYGNGKNGVLLGHYREDRMKEILYSTFFDENARTFLCTSDGTMISSQNGDTSPDSIFDKVCFNGELETEVQNGLRRALSSGESYEFQYEGTGGTGNAYAIKLEQIDWVLIQTFPSQITTKMVQNANRAGITLLIELVVIFVACLIVAQVVNVLQRKRLIRENREKSYVVDGIMQLFGTFVLVDFEEGSYRYIAGSKPRYAAFPAEGEYRQIKDLIVHMVDDDEAGESLSVLLERDALQENLSQETSVLRYEFAVKEDKNRWDSLNVICLERKNGTAVKLLFTYQDVSKLKAMEQRSYNALQEAYRAVESANRAKSDFLSNMSHDIRTPMNAIMGMTAIAAMNIDDTDRIRDCLNKITVSSQHLLGLINEVLDMSKIESGKLVLMNEEFSLSDVVESVITMFLPQTEQKHQEFKVKIGEIEHEEVIGDRMRLQQIFSNILGNAVKFTPEEGEINVSIREKPSRIQGCGCYVFVFEDNGIGMNEEFLDKLFEPFVRAESDLVSRTEGTGLGMPIVKNIVHMMNGDIQVESEVDVGSRFIVTVYLQLNHFQQEDVHGLEDMPVLVADDDQTACESACGILRDIGMAAEFVLSGDEAVEKLVRAHEECKDFAAVILDWKMPGKDGLQTAREIRQKIGEEIPIIILSAYDYSTIEQEARQAGVNAFIAKPLFRSRLVYLMKTLMLGEPEKQADVEKLLDKDYSGRRILLVEDNELNREIAEELLHHLHLTVDSVENGRLAVERVQETPAYYYDLVLMDIQMPEMNGYEATAAIRATNRDDLKKLPIVAMTADAFADDVKRAEDVGMNGHVSKPVEIRKLVDMLEKWIR